MQMMSKKNDSKICIRSLIKKKKRQQNKKISGKNFDTTALPNDISDCEEHILWWTQPLNTCQSGMEQYEAM